ncbi:iron-sulfur cluster repair di-iron protein [Ectobacillus ponti]|uniref:Iron-sulfur cluster repair di-iron protein n=1 Tax=Ectobacillus ponti TaxID=2961894 RepID=A0AA41X5L5_9BACI|nr:iron-sulfur cluster repair di-iron protein [Ectobacillus ponti]MCP8969182.1 iron-sulfur cluster repair di-iron protein [Ectobacillus ponti]
MAFTKDSIVGEIVTVFPKASDLFKANRIDFCCGGNKSLAEAAATRDIDAEAVLQTLNEQYAAYGAKDSGHDWMRESLSDLVEHVVNTHHQYLNEELPQLSPYVTKVLRVHGGGQPHLADMHRLFHELKTELEQHTIKEEASLFPLITAYEQHPTAENLQKAAVMLEELEKEHDAAGDLMKIIRDVTSDFTPPAGACRTYQMVYKRLEELESDLFQHVHLENNILFKRLSALSQEAAG